MVASYQWDGWSVRKRCEFKMGWGWQGHEWVGSRERCHWLRVWRWWSVCHGGSGWKSSRGCGDTGGSNNLGIFLNYGTLQYDSTNSKAHLFVLLGGFGMEHCKGCSRKQLPV